MRRLPITVTLVTAVLAIAAACTQPDEHALVALSSVTAPQEIAAALDAADEPLPFGGP